MDDYKNIRFKVFRFNRDCDYLSFYSTYDISVGSHELVLDVLNKIKWEKDGSLSYRRSCRHGICGACAIKVNNKAVIACKENVFDLVEIFGNELVIDPVDETKAIKDLIVDKKEFWEKYESAQPYLIDEIDESPSLENLVIPEVSEKIDEADHCIQCGVCYYSCPAVEVNDEYRGPASLAMSFRFVEDVRDTEKISRLKNVNKLGSGIWDCVKCYECAEACPKGVNPIEKITKLHNETFKERVHEKNVATRHAFVFKKSIRDHGLLDEAENVRYSEGNLGALKHIGTALQMARVGKLPLPFMVKKSENLDEIRKLIEISSENHF